MRLNNFCIVFFVSVVFADIPKLPKTPIINEIPCLTFGGTCIQKSECPSSKVSKSSLCPVQQNEGIECCHSKDVRKASDVVEIDPKVWRSRPSIPQIGDLRAMPAFETRCEYRGGECIAKEAQCPEFLTYREASDCTAEQKCCIWVD